MEENLSVKGYIGLTILIMNLFGAYLFTIADAFLCLYGRTPIFLALIFPDFYPDTLFVLWIIIIAGIIGALSEGVKVGSFGFRLWLKLGEVGDEAEGSGRYFLFFTPVAIVFWGSFFGLNTSDVVMVFAVIIQPIFFLSLVFFVSILAGWFMTKENTNELRKTVQKVREENEKLFAADRVALATAESRLAIAESCLTAAEERYRRDRLSFHEHCKRDEALRERDEALRERDEALREHDEVQNSRWVSCHQQRFVEIGWWVRELGLSDNSNDVSAQAD